MSGLFDIYWEAADECLNLLLKDQSLLGLSYKGSMANYKALIEKMEVEHSYTMLDIDCLARGSDLFAEYDLLLFNIEFIKSRYPIWPIMLYESHTWFYVKNREMFICITNEEFRLCEYDDYPQDDDGYNYYAGDHEYDDTDWNYTD